jgi:uncharacterized protein YceH (UPF0502 family)
MGGYELPKVKTYVEAIVKPIVEAMKAKMDDEVELLNLEIAELKARLDVLENE